MRFIGLKNCDTCRKALKALEAAGVVPDVSDVRADGLQADDITGILSTHDDKAINRAPTTWRGLSEADKSREPAELLALHPTLLKRPAIYANGVWSIGWKADVAAMRLGETD